MRRGFTFIEAVVVVAIVGLLFLMLYPQFYSGHRPSRRSVCQYNLKQIGLAVMQYSQDNNERLPQTWINVNRAGKGNAPSYTWRAAVLPYARSEDVFRCPSDERTNKWSPQNDWAACSYGVNAVHDAPRAPTPPMGRSWAEVVSIAETVLLTDYNADASTLGLSQASNKHGFRRTDPAAMRHIDGANYLYVDGHVKWLRPETLNCKPRTANSDEDECLWSIE